MRQCRAGSVGPQIPWVLHIRPAPLTGLRRVLPRPRSCLTPPCPHRSIPVLAALCAQIVPHVVWHQIRAPSPNNSHATPAVWVTTPGSCVPKCSTGLTGGPMGMEQFTADALLTYPARFPIWDGTFLV